MLGQKDGRNRTNHFLLYSSSLKSDKLKSTTIHLTKAEVFPFISKYDPNFSP
jgi:hypothetical protein